MKSIGMLYSMHRVKPWPRTAATIMLRGISISSSEDTLVVGKAFHLQKTFSQADVEDFVAMIGKWNNETPLSLLTSYDMLR
jgi:hypothetical protein